MRQLATTGLFISSISNTVEYRSVCGLCKKIIKLFRTWLSFGHFFSHEYRLEAQGPFIAHLITKSKQFSQKNSENCGPPLGNKFDLEVGQRSRHGTIGKVLSQRTHMPSIKALPVIAQKLWPRLKFLWQTDWQTDGRMRFNVPALSRKRGTKKDNQNDRTQINACVISNTSVCCCEHLVWRRISSKEKPFLYLFLPRPGSTPWNIWPKPLPEWQHSK